MNRLPAAAALAFALASPAHAVDIDFETVSSFASIAQYYNGGADSAGAIGPSLGVVFGADALGVRNDALGPYFSHAPSPIGVMFAVGAASTMNVASGFLGTFGFSYSSSAPVTGGVQLWSGLDGKGSLLGSFDLLNNARTGCSDAPLCSFSLLSSAFTGVARSVTFGNAANVAAFDNLTITPVPEPATVALLGAGLAAVVARRRSKAGRA